MRFFIAIFFYCTSVLALVSIAPVDIGSKPGLSGSISTSISSKRGNTVKDEYSFGGRIQYDEAIDYLIWGTLTYNYGESFGVKNEDKLYGHLRGMHNTRVDDLNSEIFLQSEQDTLRDIKGRSVVGANLRWRFLNSTEWGKSYLGVGALKEEISYSHSLDNPHENNSRINIYAAYTKKISATSKITYIGYYQPKFKDSKDYVASQTFELIIPIYGSLHLNTSAKYLKDTTPPLSVKKEDTAISTALLWEF